MTGIIASMVGATFSSGAPITAVTFDGTGDYYEKTSITSTAISTTKFVVALTYNTATTSGQTHMVNMYSTNSGTYGFYIWINNGRSQLVVTEGTTGSEVYNVYTGTTTVTTNAWEQIVWYFDMASFANTRCYKNGVSQSLTQASFNGTLSLAFNSITQIKIGQKNTSQTATGNDYNGKIAQVYVHSVTAEPSINYFWDTLTSSPKDLGVYGTATGLPRPYVYHYGTTSTFATNNGTGLNNYTLTANGNVANTAGPSYASPRTANTITAYGNAKVSTAQSVFGGSSALFDGTTDYLQTANTTNLNLGSGDFTIEFRIRFNAVDALYVPICQRTSTGVANGEWWCEVTAAEDEMYWGFKNTAGTQYYVNLSLSGTAFAINTWYHIALVRYNNNLQLYQGGTAIGSATAVTGSFGTGGNITIGALGQGSYSLNGYMDEIRISNVARYRANFTVPTARFVNDADTLLLVHCDGTNNSTTFTDDAGVYGSWDITTAAYENKSFLVNGQDTSPQGVFFKPDGTKMYMIGSTNDTVYQYSLSTAWDVSTASYDSVSFSVGGQDTVPQDIFFKDDGTKMYILGWGGDRVYQYALSTAWNLSTASYESKSMSVATQETFGAGLYIHPEGTSVYVLGQINDRIYQYNLTTAWDVSTGSYASKFVSVSANEGGSTGLHFSADGTKAYIVGTTADTVYQYVLTTPWDIATASYSQTGVPGKSFSVGTQDGNPSGLFFKPDGTKFYMVAATGSNQYVFQYSLA